MLEELRKDALAVLNSALAAADPRAAVLRALERKDDAIYIQHRAKYDLGRRRVIVVGAGKADAPMAQAIEELAGDRVTDGLVTVKYGYRAPTAKIRICEAGHPLPDENGLGATNEMLGLLDGLAEDDLVICLISGGGSALLEQPVEGVGLDDLRVMTEALLRCGASIEEMNALRKHISQVKGGQLARRAQPARLLSLILSDVLGSPLDVIASGPTAADPTTYGEAVAVVRRYNLGSSLPATILSHLESGMRGEIRETPKPGDPMFDRVTNVVVADNSIALDAAAAAARTRGYSTTLLSSRVEGEAREVGIDFARRAVAVRQEGRERAACLLEGGEPTVTVMGDGKGGRAQELTLAAAREIARHQGIVILSAGTDGTDGPTEAAGAIADGTTTARALMLGLDPDSFLERNDSFTFFKSLGDLIVTGPTNTNVNDVMIAMIG